MNRWNDASDYPRHTARGAGREPLDRWGARIRRYLRSRTADHWLMFAGGLLLGALLG